MPEPKSSFARLGPWITQFWVDGVPCGGDRYDPTFDARMVMFKREAGSLAGKRVLELGPLEGGHTIQLAREGAMVVAIEGRAANYRRCCFVKDFFGLHQVEFVLADLRSVDFRAFGQFDLIFNVGVLYHFAEPQNVLLSLRAAASGMFVSTHCAPGPRLDASIEVEGHQLPGSWWREGPLKAPLSGLQPRSFWPTRDSLVEMLTLTGWSRIKWLEYNVQALNGPLATLWTEAPQPVS